MTGFSADKWLKTTIYATISAKTDHTSRIFRLQRRVTSHENVNAFLFLLPTSTLYLSTTEYLRGLFWNQSQPN
jgi:hypothetical protein